MRSMLEVINDTKVSHDEIRLVFNHTISYKNSDIHWLNLTKIIVGIIEQAVHARNFAVVKYMQERFCIERPFNIKDEYDLIFSWSDSYYHFQKIGESSYQDFDKTNDNYQLSHAFLMAAKLGQLEIIKSLYAEHHLNHIDINNSKTEEGKTALMLAVEAGHLDVVRYLIKQNADLNSQNNAKNILWYAQVGRHKAVVDYLLPLYVDNVAPPKEFLADCLEIIETATAQNDCERVRQWLIFIGPFLTIKNSLATAYMNAVANGNLNILRLLHATNNVDINQGHGQFSKTPLMLAAKCNHHQVIRFLLENGAKLHLINKVTEKTALSYAPVNSRSRHMLARYASYLLFVKKNRTLPDILKDTHITQQEINNIFGKHIYSKFGLDVSAKDLESEIKETKQAAIKAGNKNVVINMDLRLKHLLQEVGLSRLSI